MCDMLKRWGVIAHFESTLAGSASEAWLAELSVDEHHATRLAGTTLDCVCFVAHTYPMRISDSILSDAYS